MLHLFVLLNLVLVGWLEGKDAAYDADDFGSSLVSNLRNDANLDLSIDEEYEDLRAELLAYHTALASLSDSQSRRSMMSTPCWQLGGVCIKYDLCIGYRFITEVPGCKNRLNVCCFAWNKFKIKDFRDKGIGILAMPWSLKYEYGGKGIIAMDSSEMQITKKPQKKETAGQSMKNLQDKPKVVVTKPPYTYKPKDEHEFDWNGEIVNPNNEESGDEYYEAINGGKGDV